MFSACPGDIGNNLLRLLLCLSNSVPDEGTNKLVPKVPVLYPDKVVAGIYVYCTIFDTCIWHVQLNKQ